MRPNTHTTIPRSDRTGPPKALANMRGGVNSPPMALTPHNGGHVLAEVLSARLLHATRECAERNGGATVARTGGNGGIATRVSFNWANWTAV